jgi:hypothetical protein
MPAIGGLHPNESISSERIDSNAVLLAADRSSDANKRA